MSLLFLSLIELHRKGKPVILGIAKVPLVLYDSLLLLIIQS